tara:strand:+ start:1141 stop:2049 length:909 start_codon:yes stop_codon:yes gene_type:complete
MVNYQNGKIYKIVDNDTGDVFYGSTTQKNLASCMTSHRRVDSKLLSQIIIRRQNYGYSLVENIACKNSEELNQKLRFYIDNNVCINKLNKNIVKKNNPITINNRCEACELRKTQTRTVIPNEVISEPTIAPASTSPTEHIVTEPILTPTSTLPTEHIVTEPILTSASTNPVTTPKNPILSNPKRTLTQKEPILSNPKGTLTQKEPIPSIPKRNITQTLSKRKQTVILQQTLKKHITPSNSINIKDDILLSNRSNNILPVINEYITANDVDNHKKTLKKIDKIDKNINRSISYKKNNRNLKKI